MTWVYCRWVSHTICTKCSSSHWAQGLCKQCAPAACQSSICRPPARRCCRTCSRRRSWRTPSRARSAPARSAQQLPAPEQAPGGGCPAPSRRRGARARCPCPAPCLHKATCASDRTLCRASFRTANIRMRALSIIKVPQAMRLTVHQAAILLQPCRSVLVEAQKISRRGGWINLTATGRGSRAPCATMPPRPDSIPPPPPECAGGGGAAQQTPAQSESKLVTTTMPDGWYRPYNISNDRWMLSQTPVLEGASCVKGVVPRQDSGNSTAPW